MRACTCSPENLVDLAKWSRHGVSVSVQMVWSLILPDCWHNPDVKMQQEKHEKKEEKNYFQSSACYHFVLFNAFLYYFRKEPCQPSLASLSKWLEAIFFEEKKNRNENWTKNTIENTIYTKVEQSSIDQQHVVLAKDTLLNTFVTPRRALLELGKLWAWSKPVFFSHWINCGSMWLLVISQNCNWHSADLISGDSGVTPIHSIVHVLNVLICRPGWMLSLELMIFSVLGTILICLMRLNDITTVVV